MRLNSKVLKCVNSILLLSFLISMLVPASSVHAQKLLSMEQALQLGMKNSSDLSQLNLKLEMKKIELNQSRQAVKDIRKNEQILKLSLLLDINSPEKIAVTKEIELITRILGIINEKKDIEKNIEFFASKVECDVKTAYLNVVADLFTVENNQTILEEDTKAFEMLARKYKIGKASKEQADKKKEELEVTKQALSKAMLNYENDKAKLGELLGIDITEGYSFERKLISLNIEKDSLKDILEAAREKSINIYNMGARLKLSEATVNMIKEIYRNEVGPDLELLQADLNKPGELDYTAFMTKYDKTLERIQVKWAGYFFVPMRVFILPVSKSWVQPQLGGLSYFENQKYALSVAMIQKDIDTKVYNKAVKDQERVVTDIFKNLVEMDMSYISTVKLYNKACVDYEKALKRNKIGLTSFEELDAMKKNVRTNAFSAVNLLLDYNKEIYLFNYQTGGAIKKYISNTKIEINPIGKGVAFQTGEKGEVDDKDSQEYALSVGAKWYIDSSNVDLATYFRIQVPEALGVTHFAIFTSDKRQLGVKSKVSDRIKNLPVLFTDTGELTIELYTVDTLIGKAIIDGFDSEGELLITPVSPSKK